MESADEFTVHSNFLLYRTRIGVSMRANVDDRSLALGLNTHDGALTNAPVGEALGIESVGLDSILG